MGTINSTPKTMDDSLQFGRVVALVETGTESLFNRVTIETEFAVDLDIGVTKHDSDRRKLAGHPALTDQEQQSFAALAKKIHDWGAANSKWAKGNV